MDYGKLVAKILSYPDYATISRVQLRERINNETSQVVRLVPRKEILAHATIEGFYGEIVIDLDDKTLPRDHRVAIQNIKGWIDNAANDSEFADFDLAGAEVMLGNLVKYGYRTQQQAEVIARLKFKTVKWIEAEGVGLVGDGHIESAMEMISNGIA